jgi:hypothetical protein
MRLARYRYGTETWVGVLDHGSQTVLPVAEGEGLDGQATLVRLAMAHRSGAGDPEQVAERHPLAGVCLLAPVPEPPSVRSFPGGAPPFYFVHNGSIRDPRQPVRCPPGDELEVGPAVAAVVGAHAGDADADEGLAVIAGWVVVNEWSARRMMATDRAGGLGPSKGRDFATAVGPVLVTADELGVSPPGDWVPAGEVRIADRAVARVSPRSVAWGDLVAHASANSVVRPGDLLVVALPLEAMDGAGSAGVVDLRVPDGAPVSIEVEHLGVLWSACGAPALLG